MANNNFFEIFHDIDDKYIAEAYDVPRQPDYEIRSKVPQGGGIPFRRIAASIAACLTVFAAGTFALAYFKNRANNMVAPDSIIDWSIGASSAQLNPAAVDEWLKKPLVYPLANVPGDFEFGNAVLINGKKCENILPANAGEAVYAVDDGVVTRAALCAQQMPDSEYTINWGYVVTVKHANGICTNYFHLKDAPLVECGDTVAAGQVIGSVSGDSFSGVSGLGYCISRE